MLTLCRRSLRSNFIRSDVFKGDKPGYKYGFKPDYGKGYFKDLNTGSVQTGSNSYIKFYAGKGINTTFTPYEERSIPASKQPKIIRNRRKLHYLIMGGILGGTTILLWLGPVFGI